MTHAERNALEIHIHAQIVALDDKHRKRPRLIWDRSRGEVRDHIGDKINALETALVIMSEWEGEIHVT